MNVKIFFAGVLIWTAVAGPSFAQDPAPDAGSPPDWDVVRQGDDVLLATVAYTPGLAIGVRCKAGQELDAFLYGLPASNEPWTRSLELADETAEFRQQNWAATTDPTTAFNLLPARFARSLRLGGVLQVRARDENGRRMRYVMELPTSPSAIDQVLTSCGVPTIDPRDALLAAAGPITGSPTARDWTRRPRPNFPDGARVAWGTATLSCITAPAGDFGDCIVESEYPRGYGFGREALRSVTRARVTAVPEEVGPLITVFTIRFRVEGYDSDGRIDRDNHPSPFLPRND